MLCLSVMWYSLKETSEQIIECDARSRYIVQHEKWRLWYIIDQSQVLTQYHLVNLDELKV